MKRKLIFSVPTDLYFEGLEIVSRDIQFQTPDLATIDIDVAKQVRGGLSYLEVTIQQYPPSLEGVEVEISVLGSFETSFIDLVYTEEFPDEFVNEWA